MKKVVLIPILTNDYYNVPKFYRFMPNEIFNALEEAYIKGNDVALVDEYYFLRMITATKINDGTQNN